MTATLYHARPDAARESVDALDVRPGQHAFLDELVVEVEEVLGAHRAGAMEGPPDLGHDTYLFDGALSSFGLSSARNRDRDKAIAATHKALFEEAAELADMPAPTTAVPGKPMASMARRSLGRKGGVEAEKKKEIS